MTEIIGGPLQAAAEAQTRQAETAADFINQLQIKQQATPEKPAKPQINQIYRPKRIQLSRLRSQITTKMNPERKQAFFRIMTAIVLIQIIKRKCGVAR